MPLPSLATTVSAATLNPLLQHSPSIKQHPGKPRAFRYSQRVSFVRSQQSVTALLCLNAEYYAESAWLRSWGGRVHERLRHACCQP